MAQLGGFNTQRGPTHISKERLTKMRDKNSIPQNSPEDNPIPTIAEIIAAPEGEWRELCALADANVDFIAQLRTREQTKVSGEAKPKRRSRRSRRPSTSTRNWSASSVLIAGAMAEQLDRVNEGKLDGDGECQSILITSDDQTVVMEVVA